MSEASSPFDVAAFRREMPITRRFAYFDHAAVAPLPLPSSQAIAQWLTEASELGDTVWPQWSQRIETTRSLAAKLVNASSDDIALVPNTTWGLNLVARGFPWNEGDEIVIPSGEFPSNHYAWTSLAEIGVKTHVVPIGPSDDFLDRMISACTPRTRMIACSWVGYVTGRRIDVAALCRAAHERGVLVMLDAIQGLGVFPLDVAACEVDFLTADGHKWLLGPEGAGLFYRRAEHADLLRSIGAGWNSVEHRYDFNRLEWHPRTAAARFEGGSHNMAGFIGLGASLDLLFRFGAGPHVSAVGERIARLSRTWSDRLRESGAELLSVHEPGSESGIITFRLAESHRADLEPQALRARALAEGIVLSVRGGGLRLSPHAYNTDDDFERVWRLLEST